MGVKVKEYPGTPLRVEDIEEGRVIYVDYKPKLEYRWAAGIAIGRFLQGLKEGKIVGSKCGKCGRVVVPPRAFCEWCFRPVDEWPELPDTGIVATFSISYIAADTTRLKEPVTPAVVLIDGTSNAGILHMIGEVDPKSVKAGMRVKAVWKPAGERTGSITDIRYFRPYTGA